MKNELEGQAFNLIMARFYDFACITSGSAVAGVLKAFISYNIV